ncbi:hypothetical protein, partial [Escherichia coli]|uniref:hypothetical protein n=1 Tax=Escherichia coli TaxID=562 RepID=UPI0021C596C8
MHKDGIKMVLHNVFPDTRILFSLWGNISAHTGVLVFSGRELSRERDRVQKRTRKEGERAGLAGKPLT